MLESEGMDKFGTFLYHLIKVYSRTCGDTLVPRPHRYHEERRTLGGLHSAPQTGTQYKL